MKSIIKNFHLIFKQKNSSPRNNVKKTFFPSIWKIFPIVSLFFHCLQEKKEMNIKKKRERKIVNRIQMWIEWVTFESGLLTLQTADKIDVIISYRQRLFNPPISIPFWLIRIKFISSRFQQKKEQKEKKISSPCLETLK